MPKPKIKKEHCFGCMMCTVACPRGVLIEPETGMIPAIKTPNECTACMRCVDECPHEAILIIEVEAK
jgi:NAD-dependent dihydropyrimidine dehydrogenase PreA subunit